MSEVIKMPERDPFGKPVILPTREREIIRQALDAGLDLPDLGIVFIVTAPGVGKTETAREWATESEDARCSRLLITMSKTTGTLTAGLRLVADEVERQADEYGGSVGGRVGYWVREQIGYHIRKWRGVEDEDQHAVRLMIVIDEAQHMQDALVEELRHVQETTRVGMAFLGNPKSRASSYFRYGRGADHLRSRFGPYVDLPGASPDSVALLARHYKVGGKREVDRLQQVARMGGNLRDVNKILRFARLRLCGGDVGLPLMLDHIDRAAAMLNIVPAVKAR
jgi:DNA transposition AAA+ family ATPase